MAFSKKQYENFVRTITVAAVAKGFRKAKIVESLIKRAISDGKVATGGLIRPDVSNSIIPTRDDRWLLSRDSVIIRVGKVEQGLPKSISVELNVSFGTDPDYVFTRKDNDAEYPASFPNVARIKTWIRAKSDKGLMSFSYRNKPADLNNQKVLNRIAYLISRKIKDEGIQERYKSNYFKPVKNQVQKSLDKALSSASQRIAEKYEEEFYNSVTNIIDKNIL